MHVDFGYLIIQVPGHMKLGYVLPCHTFLEHWVLFENLEEKEYYFHIKVNITGRMQNWMNFNDQAQDFKEISSLHL